MTSTVAWAWLAHIAGPIIDAQMGRESVEVGLNLVRLSRVDAGEAR